MNTRRVAVLMIVALACLSWVVPGCAQQPVITADEAKAAVRDFEGDQALEFGDITYEADTPEAGYVTRPMYELRLEVDANHSRSWMVNAITGEVDYAYYGDRFPDQESVEPTGPFSETQCRQIAESLARSKYASFESMGFQLRSTDWLGNGWRFQWSQVFANGAEGVNSVEVQVSAQDGSVQTYSSVRVPSVEPRNPSISAGDALAIARQATGLVSVHWQKGPSLVTDSDGNIAWDMAIRGTDAQGNAAGYAVTVDAESGDVLHIAIQGPTVPVTVVDNPSMISGALGPLRELAAKVPGARVHWLGKDGARVFVGKNRYTLVPGRDTIEWTGGTIKLSAKMKIVGGRLMVPSGLLDVLKSAPAAKKAPPARRK